MPPIDDPVENAFWRERRDYALLAYELKSPWARPRPRPSYPKPPREAESALQEAMAATDPFGARGRRGSPVAPVPGRLGDPVRAAARTPLPPTPLPARATTAAWTRCGPPDGGGRGTFAGATRPTGGFSAAWMRCAMRAEEIGEDDEEQRCALFLRQLDPDWDKEHRGTGCETGDWVRGRAARRPVSARGGPGHLRPPATAGPVADAAGIYLLGSAAGARRNLMTHNLAVQVATEPKTAGGRRPQ